MNSTSVNRAYLASSDAFAQIQPDGRTSDTLGTLGEMLARHYRAYKLLIFKVEE